MVGDLEAQICGRALLQALLGSFRKSTNSSVKSYGMKLKGTVVVSPDRGWTPEIRAVYLQNETVLIVARTRIEGTWRAYVDGVAGVSLETDTRHVLNSGTKMIENLARGYFPEFGNLPYAK